MHIEHPIAWNPAQAVPQGAFLKIQSLILPNLQVGVLARLRLPGTILMVFNMIVAKRDVTVVSSLSFRPMEKTTKVVIGNPVSLIPQPEGWGE